MKQKTLAQIGNISGVTDRETAGNQISYLVWLYLMTDVDRDRYVRNVESREVGDVPMKAGKYPIFVEAISDNIEDKSTGEGGDITSTVTNTFNFIIGGNRDNSLDLIENYVGGYFLLVYQECNTGNKKILGTPCKPMRLKSFERVNGKESRSISLTFENKSFIQPYNFTGTPTQEPPVTIASSATTLQLSSKYRYEIGEGTSSSEIISLSGVSDAMKGKVVTLIGKGGTGPSVLKKNETFILSGDWVADAGSTISLKIFDESHMVEVSRS